ncbi:MAG: hypothetical protein ABR511_10605 [Acidimicrobiales bacterium]
MRRTLGIVAGAGVAAAGAVILGEYPLSGLLGFGSGLLLGLFVAEAIVMVGRERDAVAAAAAAVLAAAGLVWTAWISAGHELGRLPASGWAAVALGVVAAGVRAGSPRGGRHSPSVPSPPG